MSKPRAVSAISTSILFALLTWSIQTVARDSTRITAGAYYSSGDYGTATTTEIHSLSVGIRHRHGPWVMQATLPWLRIHGGNVLPDGTTGSGTGGGREGVGDLVASLERRLFYSHKRHLGLSLRGKVKFPTASRKQGLGTGERDETLELRGFGRLGRITLFGALGYRWYGDSATIRYNDVWLGRIGLSYPVADGQKLGVSAHYRQKTRSGRDDRRSLLLYHSIRWDADWKLQTYLIKGFSDASADLALGMGLQRRF
jgi:hypothetical protein